jgi:GT2 family glycosyltransferase
LTYFRWIEHSDQLGDDDLLRIRQHIAHFTNPPHFYLLLVADDAGHEVVQMALDSLKRQFYRNFTCVVLDVTGKVDDAFNSEAALNDVGMGSHIVLQQHVAAWLDQFNASLANNPAGEWVMLLRAGEALAAHALYWFACEAQARPEAVVLYSDDDTLNEEGRRCQPRFKPDWSPVHLCATNYVGDAVVLRGSEVAASGGVSLECCQHGNYDLLLRVVDVVGDEGTGKAAHIPVVLLHRGCTSLPSPLPRGGRGFDQGGWGEPQWCMQVLRAHLARIGVAGSVSGTLPGCWRVRYHLPETVPLVSIIIPTRDALALIRQCVSSLLEKTTYPRFEILVVDNQSAEPDALAYLAEIAGRDAVRVLRYDHPFNYSAINNFAVREARGEVLCLLNNDTEVISPDWLEEMVGQLLQPKVGAVGAKLYYPDGRVQHAGDTVGPGGCANHLHSFIEHDDPGYCNRAVVAQELSAVTAACLLTRRDLYLRLGGLNEKELPVAFNDVDYCLRVREAGYKVVWTPHAELYHHESVSRGKDKTPEKARRARREVKYMRKRWKHVMKHDPFYNPNLSYERPDFSLSYAPGVKKPWQKQLFSLPLQG